MGHHPPRDYLAAVASDATFALKVVLEALGDLLRLRRVR